MTGPQLIWVFMGGGLGSVVRFIISRWYLISNGDNLKFPWPTFWANICACFILGLVIFYDEEKQTAGVHFKYALAIGFCGGFSTFSTFSLEILNLLKKDQWLISATYLTASVLLGILAVYLGKKIPTIF